MTNPTVLSMLLDSIDDLKATVDQRFDRQDRMIDRRFDDQDEKIDRIEVQTTATNGRVRKVEKWQAHVQGAQAAHKWIAPFVASMFCGTGGTIITLALTGKLG